ncbi:MAG: hypothetical protein IKF42_12880, partial [Mogibacterium sp.]|nr:hypothetical protein [Mogibacterium sp.]
MKLLTNNSSAIQHLKNVDDRLAKVIQTIGPISISLYSDGFSFLVHEIIEQMLQSKWADIYANKLKNKFRNV